jgi:hypothetical protein
MACLAIRLNVEQDLSVRLVQKISADDTLAFVLVSGMECDAAQMLISKPLAIEQLYLIGSPIRQVEQSSAFLSTQALETHHAGNWRPALEGA